VSVVFLLSLVSIHDDPQEISRLLEFQYEQKLSNLTTENMSLRKQLDDLKKKSNVCEASEPLPVEATKPAFEAPLKVRADEEKTLYRAALEAIENENWDEAVLRMEHFVRYFSKSELADNAIYWMAEIYVRKNELGLAREELARILRDFPNSDRVARAQQLLEKINGGNP